VKFALRFSDFEKAVSKSSNGIAIFLTHSYNYRIGETQETKMSLDINDIEKRLQSLIEVYIVKYLPEPTYQDRIAQRLSETLRNYFISQGSENAGLPHKFALVVHPSTLAQWNQDKRLLNGLTKIFGLAVEELGIRSEAAPSFALVADPLIKMDDLEVRLVNTDVAETQDMKNDKVNESSPSKPAFLIVGGTKVFAIHTAVTNIGRRIDNHLVIDDPRISRYHAQVRYVNGRFIIFDLNSTGGTYVNGQRANQSVLYPGDVISLSGLPIIFGQDNLPPNLSTGDTAPLTTEINNRRTAGLSTLPPTPKPEI
jgi:hypothetical protein